MMTKTIPCITMMIMVVMGCAGPGTEGKPSDTRQASLAVESSTASGPVIATFGGKSFTEGDLRAEIAKLNGRARKALDDIDRRAQFVENYILSTLIYDEGLSRGFNQEPQLRKQIADLERRLVIQKVMQEHQSAPVSEEDVRAYYDNNANEFRTDRIKASHILVKEEALAKEIRAKLEADPSAFAALAEEHSIDKSNASRGGDLGFFGRGRMVKEFEEAAFALSQDGEISDPVKTRFGYHIIQRVSREDGTMKPFDEVKNQIRIRLINEKRRSQTEDFLANLKKKANYSLDREALASVDLSGLPEPDGR